MATTSPKAHPQAPSTRVGSHLEQASCEALVQASNTGLETDSSGTVEAGAGPPSIRRSARRASSAAGSADHGPDTSPARRTGRRVRRRPPVHPNARGRLPNATRAILLLRRAAISLRRLGGRPNNQVDASPQPPDSPSVGFTQEKSNTATCSPSCDGSPVASDAGFGRRHGSVADSLRSSAIWQAFRHKRSQSSQPPPTHQAGEPWPSEHTPPPFLVPRSNTLRLPILCRIRSIEGELMHEVFVHRYELGEYLLESLKASLGLTDYRVFGFKLCKSIRDQEDPRTPWLDQSESIAKQLKSSMVAATEAPSKSEGRLVGSSSSGAVATISSTLYNNPQRSCDVYLRIKFYPPNMARVQDPFVRDYLWLQLRRDLRLGKLTSSLNNLAHLMACVLQFELGDYARLDRDTLEAQLSKLSILPNQDLIEEKALQIWCSKQLQGLMRHQAQMQFLRLACILETYGFDYWPVRDHQRQRAYLLGYNYAGIKTIRNGRIVHHFRWHEVNKIAQERRMIIFHVQPSRQHQMVSQAATLRPQNRSLSNLPSSLSSSSFAEVAPVTGAAPLATLSVDESTLAAADCATQEPPMASGAASSARKQVLGFKCLTADDCRSLYFRLLEQKYFFTFDLAYFGSPGNTDTIAPRPMPLLLTESPTQPQLHMPQPVPSPSMPTIHLAANPSTHHQSGVEGCRECQEAAAAGALSAPSSPPLTPVTGTIVRRAPPLQRSAAQFDDDSEEAASPERQASTDGCTRWAVETIEWLFPTAIQSQQSTGPATTGAKELLYGLVRKSMALLVVLLLLRFTDCLSSWLANLLTKTPSAAPPAA